MKASKIYQTSQSERYIMFLDLEVHQSCVKCTFFVLPNAMQEAGTVSNLNALLTTTSKSFLQTGKGVEFLWLLDTMLQIVLYPLE